MNYLHVTSHIPNRHILYTFKHEQLNKGDTFTLQRDTFEWSQKKVVELQELACDSWYLRVCQCFQPIRHVLLMCGIIRKQFAPILSFMQPLIDLKF